MSWDSYVSQQLVGSGHMAQGAIHGLDGNKWTSSANLAITVAECKAIISAITSNDGSAFFANGFTLGGVKYTFVKIDGRFLVGRKGADAGCVISKVNTCIIVGIHAKDQDPRQMVNTVERLADYFISINY